MIFFRDNPLNREAAGGKPLNLQAQARARRFCACVRTRPERSGSFLLAARPLAGHLDGQC